MRDEHDWVKRQRHYFINALFTARLQHDLLNIPAPELPAEITSTYIFGKADTGKTVYAAFMMLQEVKALYLAGGPIDQYQKCIFISTPELFHKIKTSYNHMAGDETEDELINYYSRVHLLVLDDIGVDKATDWVLQTLYLIINRRYEAMKKTIFTSNLSLEALAASLGDDRITSRIARMGQVFEKLPYKVTV
jgi:DNA replication protein DnaC